MSAKWLRGKLPERKSDDPITAYKHAWLSIEKPHPDARPQFVFRPLNWGPPYRVEARAICVAQRTSTPSHDAPRANCSCGFYAYRCFGDMSLASPWNGRPSVALTVELAGRVIVHQIGYRAEYQRVMRAVLYGVNCNHEDVIDYERIDVTTFGSTSSTFVQGLPITAACGRPATFWRPDWRPDQAHLSESTPLFLCDHHAHGHDPRDLAPIGTLLDRLRTDLPTEWATP